ncbi:MAG: hypothetical protein KatS3mg077_2819 [Candidatus Binatia bacterium]|nr:MAG: hypothetical protein KatS3mg077_2819 [Candidatus Binatia bacterium]
MVRRLALASTDNPNELRVLAIVQGRDNAARAPADTLALNFGFAFSFALFQTATEAEGFANLVFTTAALPAPALGGWVVAGLCGMLVWIGARPLRLQHRASFRRSVSILDGSGPSTGEEPSTPVRICRPRGVADARFPIASNPAAMLGGRGAQESLAQSLFDPYTRARAIFRENAR